MTNRRCGHSGILLPEISLGLWHNFGANDSFENMRQMCFTAFDNGITHFDLANNYGRPVFGSAEENFGKILRDEVGIEGHKGDEAYEATWADLTDKYNRIKAQQEKLIKENGKLTGFTGLE